jgi:hypothetical protein
MAQQQQAAQKDQVGGEQSQAAPRESRQDVEPTPSLVQPAGEALEKKKPQPQPMQSLQPSHSQTNQPQPGATQPSETKERTPLASQQQQQAKQTTAEKPQRWTPPGGDVAQPPSPAKSGLSYLLSKSQPSLPQPTQVQEPEPERSGIAWLMNQSQTADAKQPSGEAAPKAREDAKGVDLDLRRVLGSQQGEGTEKSSKGGLLFLNQISAELEAKGSLFGFEKGSGMPWLAAKAEGVMQHEKGEGLRWLMTGSAPQVSDPPPQQPQLADGDDFDC